MKSGAYHKIQRQAAHPWGQHIKYCGEGIWCDQRLLVWACEGLPKMLDITLDDQSHYALRLTDLGNGILSAFKQSKYVAKVTTLREDQVTWLREENFLVESQTIPDKVYRLNMRSGFCECVAGNYIDQSETQQHDQ